MDPIAEPLGLPGEYGKATTMAWEAVRERRSTSPTDATRFAFG
jgi:hypothetical protein